ncbi:MAG: cysteine desulfurase [Candidatus Paceibacteria bacterium]|jgi:cysteine desulfurase
MKSDRIYLDWAAATPLSKNALVAMMPYLSGKWGNPSAIHAEGQVTRNAVEEARQTIATAVQVRPEFVTFTSGGTEGNNLAIFGVIESLAQSGRAYESMAVITTKIEHPSVGETCTALKRRGVQVRYVQVTETGKVDLEHLRTVLDKSVVLFSTALINSEIGTIQPAHAIRKILKTAEKQFDTEVFFHLDAAQAPLWTNCQFDSLSADFVILDAAKCCGPKGVGTMIRSRRTNIVPVVHGGGQESGLRPGTENVAGIVGAAIAIKEAQGDYQTRAESATAIRDQAIEHIQSKLPQAVINGARGGDRVANNINISIPGLDTEFAAVVLDKHGFAVSTKSACSGAGGGASTVVLETTADPSRAASTLRITLGPDTTLDQIKALTVILKQHIEQMSQY